MNMSFCEECGSYIAPGQDEIFISNGTFEIVCKRCYRLKMAALAADTARKKVEEVSRVGVNA